MRIVATFVKPAHRTPMQSAGGLTLIGGLGIAGDVNARPDTPRHILFTSASVYAGLGLAPGDLRENVIVDGEVESWRSGQLIRIGASATVRITYACEPCFRLNEVRPLLARHLAGRRGMLGRVLVDGEIRPGDAIAILPSALPEIPYAPRERLYTFVNRIPVGRVASFADAARTLGLPKAYTRVMPRFLRDAPPSIPIHRMISESGRLISQHIPLQDQSLHREGVVITHASTVDMAFRWDSLEFFAEEWLKGYYPAVSV